MPNGLSKKERALAALESMAKSQETLARVALETQAHMMKVWGEVDTLLGTVMEKLEALES